MENLLSRARLVGVTFLQAGDTAQSYVERADEYMYIAKNTGDRVAVVCFGQILDSQPKPKFEKRAANNI